MIQLAAILFATLFTYGASLAAGVSLLRLLRARLYRSEILFLGFVLGSACLSLITFLLTACSLAYPAVFLAAGAIVIAYGARSRQWAAASSTLPGLPRGLATGWWLVYGVFALLYLANALLPETSPDALAYHVAFPARYLQYHGFAPIAANLLAGMPQGADMLFLFACALGGFSAPAMVHLLFLFTLPLGMAAYGRRAGYPVAGACAALLFFLSPIAGKTGTAAYVDVALAAVAFALVYALQIWREEPQPGLLAPLGILAGFSFSIKYTAFLAFLYVLALVLLRARRPRLRPALIVAAAALAFALPCLVKNQVMLGNPVFPFANRLFPNPVIQPAFEDIISRQMRNYGSVSLVEIPLETTVNGLRLTGVVGPLFLLAPLALLALRRSEGRQVLLAALVFGLPYFANLGTRFLLPCLPFFSLAMAMALARPVWLGSAVVLAHAVLSYPPVLSRYVHPGAWRIEGTQWAAALRLKPEPQYLQQTLAEYEMSLEINKNVPREQGIFSLSGFPQLYVQPQIVLSGQSSQANSYRDTLLTPALAELRPTHRYASNFAPLAVNAVRIHAHVPFGAEPWTVTEFRVVRAGSELPRDRRWRLRASSNIWETPAAFDNNPVTKWTAGEAGNAPQFLEVDFDRDLTLDEVWLDGPPPPDGVVIQIFGRGRGRDGAWRDIPSKISEHQLPRLPKMRRAAIETLKKENIGWLLVSDRDLGSQDFSERASQWGITLICHKGRFSLYRFD
ncbi:MAG TPA: discoidin domain-containing protein [Paludibaculum sp.]